MRAARRVQAAGGATRTTMTDRRRSAARRMREIAAKLRTRAKLAGEERSQAIGRVTGELAGLAEAAVAQAAVAQAVAVLRNGRRALPRALTGRTCGRLRRALEELAVTVERAATVAAQARSRLAGQMPDGTTRLVSLHDPDARPIRKGRIDRPVEFGYKAQVLDNDDGIVVDYTVESGAVPDGPRRATRHQAGRPPRWPGAAHGHRRPRLRAGRRRARPARRGRAHRGDSPPGHNFSRPQGHRAQPRLPQARQVAHRMRRPDQLRKTQLLLGPHPAGRSARSGHLARARDIHSQPDQDRNPGQLTRHSQAPPGTRTRLADSGRGIFRSK